MREVGEYWEQDNFRMALGGMWGLEVNAGKCALDRNSDFLMNFPHLMKSNNTSRMNCYVLQAACNPVAYSLMADFYPAEHRAIVFSIYHYGVYVGESIANGVAIHYDKGHPSVALILG